MTAPCPDRAQADQQRRVSDGRACFAAALDYLARGWSVTACCPSDHVGVGKVSKNHSSTCDSKGKSPWHLWKELQTRLPTEAEVRQWWSCLPNSNVGACLGPVSGIVRIDVDGLSGEAMLQAKSGGDLPLTIEFKSGSSNGNSRGLLYAIPPGVTLRTTIEKKKKKGEKKQELRFQAQGAQTVLPPSRHPDGGLYAWKPGRGPGEIEAALMPAWLVAEMAVGPQSNHTKTTSNGKPRAEPIAEGELLELGRRDTVLTSMAGTMRRRGFTEEPIFLALAEVNRTRCSPLLSEDVVRKIARSIASYPSSADALPDNDPHRTDSGNALRLVRAHGIDLRHCGPWAKWLVWDGRRWQQDEMSAHMRLAKATINGLFDWTIGRLMFLRGQRGGPD